jgi:small subunit ribosomal protein S21
MSKGKSLVSVQVRNGDINKALKIFKKRGFDSGHLQELRDRKEYTKPSVAKRKQKQQAVRREQLQNMIDKIEGGDMKIKLPEKKSKKK